MKIGVDVPINKIVELKFEKSNIKISYIIFENVENNDFYVQIRSDKDVVNDIKILNQIILYLKKIDDSAISIDNIIEINSKKIINFQEIKFFERILSSEHKNISTFYSSQNPQ